MEERHQKNSKVELVVPRYKSDYLRCTRIDIRQRADKHSQSFQVFDDLLMGACPAYFMSLSTSFSEIVEVYSSIASAIRQTNILLGCFLSPVSNLRR